MYSVYGTPVTPGYRGYLLWHGHPASVQLWSATGTDGSVWFSAETKEALLAAIDEALAAVP